MNTSVKKLEGEAPDLDTKSLRPAPHDTTRDTPGAREKAFSQALSWESESKNRLVTLREHLKPIQPPQSPSLPSPRILAG